MLSAAIDHIGQHLQLIGAEHAIGQPQAHHEAPRSHGSEEDAQPLEMDGEGGLIQGFPTLAPEFGQARGQIQPAGFGLGLLHLVEGRLHRGRRREGGHGADLERLDNLGMPPRRGWLGELRHEVRCRSMRDEGWTHIASQSRDVDPPEIQLLQAPPNVGSNGTAVRELPRRRQGCRPSAVRPLPGAARPKWAAASTPAPA